MNYLRVLRLAGLPLLALGIAAPRAFAQGAVPTAAREIPRGTELTAADIRSDTVAGTASATRIGWVTRSLVHTGESLQEPLVQPPRLVRAGTDVTVRAESGSVVVTRAGTALTSGSIGDRVRVRIDPLHTVTGIVAALATVKIQ